MMHCFVIFPLESLKAELYWNIPSMSPNQFPSFLLEFACVLLRVIGFLQIALVLTTPSVAVPLCIHSGGVAFALFLHKFVLFKFYICLKGDKIRGNYLPSGHHQNNNIQMQKILVFEFMIQ